MVYTSKGSSASTSASGMQFHKLSAHADSLKFQRFLRAFIIRGNKDYGYMEIMWVPPGNRHNTVPFSPLAGPCPMESIEEFEAKHKQLINTLEADLFAKEAQLGHLLQSSSTVIEDPMSLDATLVATATAAVAAATATATAVDGTHQSEDDTRPTLAPDAGSSLAMEPGRSALNMCRMQVAEARNAVDRAYRRCDHELKLLNAKRQAHENEKRKHEAMCKVHSQWVSLLKESIDVADATRTIDGLTTLTEMLDALYKSCNSRNSMDMHAEWDRRWAQTRGVFPINVLDWSDLRDRFFVVQGGFTAEHDKTLSMRFKRRLLEVIPSIDRDYAPLVLAIQNDKIRNELTSASLLADIEEIEKAKQLESSDKPLGHAHAKFAGQPGPALVSGLYCAHHRTNSHNTADCYTLKRKLNSGSVSGKRQASRAEVSRGAATPYQRDNKHKGSGKDDAAKHTSQHHPRQKPSQKKRHISELDSQIKSLATRLESLTSQFESQKVRILTAQGENMIYHLDNILPEVFSKKNSIFLDSGANQHVGPMQLEIGNVTEVTNAQSIVGATNNNAQIQARGDLEHWVGGELVKFSGLLKCDRVTDTLISCSKWLDGTQDRIVLTAKNAFYQKHGSQDLHEIARVVNGMYCMNPLAEVNEHARDVAADFIATTKLGQPHNIPVFHDKSHAAPLVMSTTGDAVKTALDRFTMNAMSAGVQNCTMKDVMDTGVHVYSVQLSHTNLQLNPTELSSKEEEKILLAIHSKFGHFNLRKILLTLRSYGGKKNKEMVEFEKILSKKKSFPSTLELCSDCAKGKIKQRSVFATASPAKRILGRIHTDCIPLPCESPNRDKHGTIVVDGFSRWTAIDFHKEKSQSAKKLENIITRWENEQLPLKVGAVRHDGGELQKSFKDFCTQHNIADEPSPPYAKEFNGMAERTYGVHKGNAISLLKSAHLPPKFTSFALEYSVFIKNRLAHPDDTDTTPYKMWYKRDPDMTSFKPFGCKVTVWKALPQRGSVYEPRGVDGVFLGYKGESLYWVYLNEQRKIVHAAHAVFHTTEFPGVSVSRDNQSDREEMLSESRKRKRSPYHLRSWPHREENQKSAEDTIAIASDLDETQDINDAEEIHHIKDSVSNETDDVQDGDDENHTAEVDHETVESDSSDNYLELEMESESDSDTDGNRQSIFAGVPAELETAFESEPEHTPEQIQISSGTRALMSRYGMNSIVLAKSTPIAKTDASKEDTQTTDVPYPNPKDKPPPRTISLDGLPKPPRSRKEMLSSKYRDYFIEAEHAELNAMHQKQVWIKGPRVPGRKCLRPKWVYTYKKDKTLKYVDKFKARLVGMGNTQTKGVDYVESFSPVVKIQSLRIMMVIATRLNMLSEQTDVDTAYLNADLDIQNYMLPPEGYEERDELGNQIVLHLVKSIYGLHQAGREWNKLLKKTLTEIGYMPLVSDPCLFMKSGEKKSFVLVYVDDMVVLSFTQGEIDDFKDQIKKHFSIKELGPAKHVLGLVIERTTNGTYLGQPMYAKKILESAGVWNYTPKLTPLPVNWEHDDKSPLVSKERRDKYHSINMQLMYLSTQTRPDLAFAVNTLAQYQQDCHEHDWKALLYVLRYLKGTWDYGLNYTNQTSPIATLHTNEPDIEDGTWFIPQGFADASHAREPGRKSRSGHVFMMAGAAVTWFSKKQPVVALSSTEAEYYALSECVKEALWIRQLFEEIGMTINDPTVVHQDNMSTMAIAMNPIQHQRVKHMDIRVHHIRDHLDKQDIKLVYCPTEDMIGDILTKALPGPQHRKLTSLLGLRSLAALKGEARPPYTNDRRF